MNLRRTAVCALLSLTAISCGEDEIRTGASGLDLDSPVVELSFVDAKQFCTWMIEELAHTGWGRTTDCDGTDCTDPESGCDDVRVLNSCIASIRSRSTSCTVEDLETCVPALVDANDICAWESAAECEAWRNNCKGDHDSSPF